MTTNLERQEKLDGRDLLSQKIGQYQYCRKNRKERHEVQERCEYCIYKRECESLLRSYGGW